MTVYNTGNIYLEDLNGGTSDQIHIYAQTDNIADGAVTVGKLDPSGVPVSIDMLADNMSTRINLGFVPGGLSTETGDEIEANNNYRSGYVAIDDVAYCQGGTGYTIYAYFYSYDTDTQQYTYISRKRLMADDSTSDIVVAGATHFRIVRYATAGIEDGVPYVGAKTGLYEAIKNLESDTDLGYWYSTYAVSAGSQHSAGRDTVNVTLKSGDVFAFRHQTNVPHGFQMYAYEPDGTSHRLLQVTASGAPYTDNYWVFTAPADIARVGTFFTAQTSDIEVRQSVYSASGAIASFGLTAKTGYYIESDGYSVFLQRGRDRSQRQCVAVLGDDIWEFGTGNAYSNGTTYELQNGHGNNCNWGSVAHGDYPYLYCPLWTDGHTINVLSFDGTAFSVADTIDIGSSYTGHLNAYVDDATGFIYALVNADTSIGDVVFVIADLSGNVISSTAMPYRIPAIQGMCMHRGRVIVTGGLGTSASPSYIYELATDGTMLDKRLVSGIGEIEGICWLSGQLVVASYNALLYSPTVAVPDRVRGIADKVG